LTRIIRDAEVADDAGFVNLLAGQADFFGGRDILNRNIPFALAAVVLNSHCERRNGTGHAP
jgi:hypothetical protein